MSSTFSRLLIKQYQCVCANLFHLQLQLQLANKRLLHTAKRHVKTRLWIIMIPQEARTRQPRFPPHLSFSSSSSSSANTHNDEGAFHNRSLEISSPCSAMFAPADAAVFQILSEGSLVDYRRVQFSSFAFRISSRLLRQLKRRQLVLVPVTTRTMFNVALDTLQDKSALVEEEPILSPRVASICLRRSLQQGIWLVLAWCCVVSSFAQFVSSSSLSNPSK